MPSTSSLVIHSWKTIGINTIIFAASLMFVKSLSCNEKHAVIEIIAKLVGNILTFLLYFPYHGVS